MLINLLALAGSATLAATAPCKRALGLPNNDLGSLQNYGDIGSFFFPPKESYGNIPPGQIVTHHSITVNSSYVHASNVYQVTFRSDSSQGGPALGVSTIFVPENPKPNVLVSYQVAEDAVSALCAPSVSAISKGYDDTIEGILSKNFIVSVPDHEGYDSAFLAAAKEGHTVLDSIRAVLSAAESNLFGNALDTLKSNSTQVAMTGYSGGSHATMNAAARISSYAPDLKDKIKVIAAGGVPIKLEHVVQKINKSPYAGFAASGMVGLANDNPTYNETLYSGLTDKGIKELRTLRSMCLTEVIAVYKGIDIFKWFKDPADTWNKLLNNLEQNGVPANNTGLDMLIYNAVEDEIASVNDVDDFVTSSCQNGNKIQYRRDSVKNGPAHVTENQLVGTYVPSWLEEYFDGKTLEPCDTYHDALINGTA